MNTNNTVTFKHILIFSLGNLQLVFQSIVITRLHFYKYVSLIKVLHLVICFLYRNTYYLKSSMPNYTDWITQFNGNNLLPIHCQFIS